MRIGRADETDLREIAGMAADSGGLVGHPLHLYRILFDHFGRFMLVAREGAQVVGFQQGFPSWERSRIYFLWQVGVRRDYRMRGLAAKLVRETERVAAEAGCHAVQATVDVENGGSRALFVSLGYHNASFGKTVQREGVLAMPDYYGSGTDQILFQKILGDASESAGPNSESGR
jgi:ribosomal protein S18 acetylase RimI-like enzyme